jgi:peptidoglycan/LPS O-acetylase OafA/YrhL
MRLDIQALRGFAVLSVILYHLNFSFIPGGFLGVDIFFVISGFVITSSLNHGTGTFKEQIKAFYLRRAKRILPASLFVTLAISVAALLYLPGYSRSRYSIEALASSLFSANLNFAREGNDYLNQSLDPSPFLHYWSLGVEEQFYLLWPILFLLFFKTNRKLVAPFFIAMSVLGIYLTSSNPVVGFYSPITRAWEFLAGIFFALNPIRFKASKSWAVFGWITMIGSTLLITVNQITPGWSTMIPVIATAIIIGANVYLPAWFLLPKLGDYSFSMYLVHWPLIIFLHNKVVIISLTFVLAYLVTKFVENPFRFNPHFKLSLPQWGAGLGVLSLATFSILAIPAEAKSTLDLSTPSTYNNGCHLSFNKTWPDHACIFGDPKGKKTIYLVGDSHAAQWFEGVNQVAKQLHLKFVSITKSSCPTALIPIIRNHKVDSSCSHWQKGIISEINLHKPDLVLMSAYSEFNYETSLKGDYVQNWRNGLGDFLSQIGSTHVAFLGDTPHSPINIPSCLSTKKICDFPLTRRNATNATMEIFGVNYIDTASWLCTPKCAASYGGINNYRDATHISVSASKRLEPQLKKAITSLL